MPIVKREDFGTERAPEWCKVTGGIVGMGFSTLNTGAGVEMHFHDYEEFWFATEGKARVITEGVESNVARGDVVCTRMGDEHAVIEIVEAPYQQVWIACNRRGRGRKGHLRMGKDEPSS